ncbi:MAG: two-component system sensor protein [Deltaproteobacteria bacterium]|nr:two-component system sensor protein [Deltaproteobacteria bacterium]
MDFHLWTPLISTLVALAIAVKVVLRERKRRAHWLFVMFATNVAVWYLATFLEYRLPRTSGLLGRLTAFVAVLLPQTGVRFLRAFRVDGSTRPSWLDRWTAWLAVPLLVLVALPWFDGELAGTTIRAVIAAYVVGLLLAAVSTLYTSGRESRSREERLRALYLAGVGAAATLVTTADLVPFTLNKLLPKNFPPVGSILVLAVLYMFSEVLERQRLLDLFELAGRFLVLTALGLVLAGIYYFLVDWQELVQARTPEEGPYFLNAIVASVVILLLFDPLRAKVEERIGRVFSGERVDLERAALQLRQRLAHLLELDAVGRRLMEGLEASRRVTRAALYLADADGFERVAHLGDEPPRRLTREGLEGLLTELKASGCAVRETFERSAEERRELGEPQDAERMASGARTLDALGASVLLPLEGDAGELSGLLSVRDDRVKDAFSPEEVQILQGLAGQVGVVVENCRLHAKMKERDRLAALGEMAAGLAHEIRNPLGSIKASAQYLEGARAPPAEQKEFLGIIVEEVERLDRVVRSFLDYARPYRGNPSLLNVSQVVERAAQILRPDLPPAVKLELDCDPSLPPVRMDPEHLRQVLLNIVRNAVEALREEGAITIRARVPYPTRDVLELQIRDTGPGIDATILPNLFIPFVTTKAQGTGLGLAISQRLVQSAGGSIEVRDTGLGGSTFVISLPVAKTGASVPPPPS